MKLSYLFICGAVFILLSGCWDRVEVNDLALILGSAVDKNKNNTIEISAQVFIPKKSGGGEQGGMSSDGGNGNTLVRSATGVTVADALSKLKMKLPREAFWGHSKILVIGEKMAEEGISDLVDFMMRSPEARVRKKVFISKGSAKHTLELISPLERSTVEVLREMTEIHSVMDTPIKRLAQMMAGNANAAAVPWIEILPPEPDVKKNQTVPYIKGTAIFKKDKMVGHIDDKVTQGVLWLRNEMRTTTISVAPSEAEGLVTLNVIKNKSELVPKINDNQWSITVKINPVASLIENTTNLSYKNPNFSNELEKDLNEAIENRVKKALAQVQKEMNADIFGFSEAFYRKYPKKWEQTKDQWNEIFPKVKVYVQVASKLVSTGQADTGISRPEKEVKKK